MSDLEAMSDEELCAEGDRLKAEIDVAYWRFTRTARGVPPILAVPEAYRRRALVLALLKERRGR